ncbi:LuxR family transcriptional regulator [Nocardioides sp. Root1257]|uniref:LuxR C-terminal-related transcriptional regulator n=1 Tax=unclassified Nocardioides TaxID=2615069 RepID=UPI0006F92FBD|nr:MULTISPECIES: LuxR C-terminal-related transcriptional regulator [unclassified Nocardioides]KQW50970.1 LuxR family transcriptional regulator [Nocardioides sp. Root1257]KRC53766.1 LuxR family transcriptional regulator [Nocardioides sp. Root224]
MADTLVETKLLLPRVRRDTVARPRLHDLLDRTLDAPVTVVSAPAGFGKTTLLSARVASWLAAPVEAGDARTAAWVSLTDRDRQPGSFWTYVLHAIDRAAPGSAAAALALIQSGQAPIEAALASVVNELSVHPGEVTLVLDDYHLADGPDIAKAMTFLVEHLPGQLRLVISTRADPALPLARLRVRGELVEVRAADLRFTSEEAAAYLNDLHGLGLTTDDVAALEARTEGWAAALQLAVLSLRDRPDASAFIAGFAGDDRFVVDYLAEEVLGRQPDDVRRFLLDTSVLERLTGALCDAVSPTPDNQSGPGGRAMLDLLERQNLFVVPLDDHRRWYRYHHLFADVLHAHLLQERPDDVPALHARASRWYAANGHTEDAIRHALAAGDTATAADLVELALPDLRRDRREHDIVAWVTQLPADLLHQRPVLAVGLIGALMASNDFATVEERVHDAEQLLNRPASGLVVVDHVELERLPAALRVYRAGLALVGGDPAGTVASAEEALALAIDGDHLTIAAASGLMGLAFWTTGDVVAAHRAYTAAANGLTRAGHIADVLGCSLTIADMELALGRLRDAETTLERALALAEQHEAGGTAVMRGTADMLVALSRIAWHRDDLSAVTDLLRRADDLGEPAGLPQNPYRWRVGMARLRAAERDWSTALELLDDAQRVYVGDFSPPVHPIHATRARLLVASGDLDGARAWAREHQVGADDDLSYLREYEHLTLARLLLAEHRATSDPAMLEKSNSLLDRLLDAAVAGQRNGTVLEVEVLRAIGYRAVGDHEKAEVSLAHAVELAELDGWPRFLLDAHGLTGALQALLEQRPSSEFLRRLVAGRTRQEEPTPQPTGRPQAPETLLDPLSDRELDVLRLLGSDLDGPAIARELVVSLNTVRTHTKHIYTKLGVNNRRAAISRAHQLGLLTRSART